MFDRASYFREYRRNRKASGTWKKEWRGGGSRGDVKGQQKRYWEKHGPRVRTDEYVRKNRKQQRERRVSEVRKEYAVKLLVAGTRLKSSDLPAVLVEAKQIEIKLKRLVRNGDYRKT